MKGKHEKQEQKGKVALLNFHCGNENFGALLTAYALNKYINALGYSAQNIDYIRNQPWIRDQPENAFFDDFREKHLPRTQRFYYGDDLTVLNSTYSIFCVGSDQVWRPENTQGERDIFLLSFANTDKNLISYAASFGSSSLKITPEELMEYKYRLRMFDHVSVREESGKKICKNFGVKAQQVIDPVFLIHEEEWAHLSDEFGNGEENSAGEIIYYTIDEKMGARIHDFIEERRENLDCTNVRDITRGISIQEWLWRIRNCKMLITDSYHGVCFAIIFKKPFICISNNRGTERIQSLLSKANLLNHMFRSTADVNVEKLQTINYTVVYDALKPFKLDSERYLIESLAESPSRQAIKNTLLKEYYNNVCTISHKRIKLYRRKYRLYKIVERLTKGRLRMKAKKRTDNYLKKIETLKVILEAATKTSPF